MVKPNSVICVDPTSALVINTFGDIAMMSANVCIQEPSIVFVAVASDKKPLS
jgi:hypothetical protein